MTKREQFGLVFQKRTISNQIRPYIIQKITGGPYSYLTCIARLDKYEAEELIFDIDMSLSNGANFTDSYFTDSTEDISIKYEYPNINIQDALTISMSDMKALLNEWISFIS